MLNKIATVFCIVLAVFVVGMCAAVLIGCDAESSNNSKATDARQIILTTNEACRPHGGTTSVGPLDKSDDAIVVCKDGKVIYVDG